MSYDYDDDAPCNQYPAELVPDTMGYIPIAVTDDGDTLCEQCVVDPTNPVWQFTDADSGNGDGWGVAAWQHSGEVESATWCAHCNRELVAGPVDDDQVEGLACTDCLMLVANDDTSGIARCETAEGEAAYRAAIAARGVAWIGVGDDEHAFCKSPCDVCGATEAGARQGVTGRKVVSA